MSRYKKEMDNISVTEEMKERILNNLEKESFTAPKKSFMFMRYAAVAACCCLMASGAIAYQSYEGKMEAKPETSDSSQYRPAETAGDTSRTSPAYEPGSENNGVPATEHIPATEPVEATVTFTSKITAEPPVATETTVSIHIPATEHIPDGAETPKPPVTTVPAETTIGEWTEITATVTNEDIILGGGTEVTDDIPLGGEGVCETTTRNIDEDVTLGAGDVSSVEIPNPIKEYETLRELKSALPFEVKIPAELSGYVPSKMSSVKSELAEIVYFIGDEKITYRTAGKLYRDISGDYNVYKNERVLTVDGNTVALKSDGGLIKLAYWNDGEHSYSLSFKKGMESERVLEIIKSI